MENMVERDNAGYGWLFVASKGLCICDGLSDLIQDQELGAGLLESSHSNSRNWVEELSFKIEKLGGGSVGGACVENYN